MELNLNYKNRECGFQQEKNTKCDVNIKKYRSLSMYENILTEGRKCDIEIRTSMDKRKLNK